MRYFYLEFNHELWGPEKISVDLDVDNMKKQLKEKIRELGISIVYLFGSSATGRKTRLSDVDIGVVLKVYPHDTDTRAIYDASYRLFSAVYPDSKVDIVFLQAAPLSLQYSAIKEGKIIFEENPGLTCGYENRVINEYLDFRPILDFFDKVATEKYAKP